MPNHIFTILFSLSTCAAAYGWEPPVVYWTLADPMHQARAFFASAELPNGNLLVTGGFNNNVNLADTEIYDWRKRSWRTVALMNQVRSAPVAVTLENGRVLVTGGGNWTRTNQTNVFLKSCEIYNPRTDSWSMTGSMNDARFEDFAVFLLPGHKVLAAGGAGNGPGSIVPGLKSAEIYDEATGTWTRTSDMHRARGQFASVMLHDGRILVSGGWEHDGGPPTDTAEIFDPLTMTWSLTRPMGTPRADHFAVVLRDGRVLVGGGIHPTEEYLRLASAEIYDPDTGEWTRTGDMTYANSETAAVLLPDGRVLVTGGHINHETPSSYSTLYDPQTGTWSSAGFMSTPRAGHAAFVLRGCNGVLVFGGLNYSPLATNSVDLSELCQP
jgi:N-acetylneuraminic acid mutarotase